MLNKSEIGERESTVKLVPNSETNDNLFLSQDWWNADRLGRAILFLKLAKSMNLLKESFFSLEDQLVVHNNATPGEIYRPIVVVPFQRLDSKGNKVHCQLVLNGHHRLWVSRMQGITLEVVVDTTHHIGNVGSIRSLDELNNILSTIWGKEEIQAFRNRSLESEVRKNLNFEEI